MNDKGRRSVPLRRREVVAGGSAVVACSALARPASAARPERQRPAKGDRLVIDAGEHKGEPTRLDLLPAGGPPVAARRWRPCRWTPRPGPSATGPA
jgi:hypothetical protein